MTHATRRRARRTLLGLAAIALLACGGTPARKVTPTKKKPAAGGLAAQLKAKAKAQRGPAPTDAVVTFGVFVEADPPRDPNVAVAALRKRLRNAEGAPAELLAGVEVPLAITVAPVDDELPLNLDALAAEAGPLGERLQRARTAWFVRYAGPPLADDRHLAHALAVTALIAEPDGLVADLSTQQLHAARAFSDMLKGDWRAEQVVPRLVLADPKTALFYSQGMARFGLPDLEMTGVPVDEARAAFALFQEHLARLAAHGHASPGDTLGDIELRACERPPEAIDHQCVRVPRPTAR